MVDLVFVYSVHTLKTYAANSFMLSILDKASNNMRGLPSAPKSQASTRYAITGAALVFNGLPQDKLK